MVKAWPRAYIGVMPRTALHSRDETLEKALNLFWKKGFHATSLKDLEYALDMRPGSIYAAFRSKEALFREVLAVYANVLREDFGRMVARSPSVLDGIAEFIRRAGTRPPNDPPSRACMLVKTLLETNDDNSQVGQDARTYLAHMECAFEMAFERAIETGEISAENDARRLARKLQTGIFGLKVYAQREDFNEVVLELAEDIAQEFLALRICSSALPVAQYSHSGGADPIGR